MQRYVWLTHHVAKLRTEILELNVDLMHHLVRFLTSCFHRFFFLKMVEYICYVLVHHILNPFLLPFQNEIHSFCFYWLLYKFLYLLLLGVQYIIFTIRFVIVIAGLLGEAFVINLRIWIGVAGFISVVDVHQLEWIWSLKRVVLVFCILLLSLHYLIH